METKTVVWSAILEKEDYIKVPRTLVYLGAYAPELVGKTLQPRHVVLLLNLAARKYSNKPIRAYWEEIAVQLGVKTGTVRKWAYELEKQKMLTIRRHRGPSREQKPGVRNQRNTFDIRPFVTLLERYLPEREKRRKRRKQRAGGTL
jgi:hypothetical protein